MKRQAFIPTGSTEQLPLWNLPRVGAAPVKGFNRPMVFAQSSGHTYTHGILEKKEMELSLSHAVSWRGFYNFILFFNPFDIGGLTPQDPLVGSHSIYYLLHEQSVEKKRNSLCFPTLKKEASFNSSSIFYKYDYPHSYRGNIHPDKDIWTHSNILNHFHPLDPSIYKIP